MTEKRQLVVFVIQAVFKSPKPHSSPNDSLAQMKQRYAGAASYADSRANGALKPPAEEPIQFDEFDCIENFKMARRCTIEMDGEEPALLDSFADYFIVGGYRDKPFNFNIFERNKTNLMSVDLRHELGELHRRYRVRERTILGISQMVVPRLRWSDRLPERFEQRKRIFVTMDNFNRNAA